MLPSRDVELAGAAGRQPGLPPRFAEAERTLDVPDRAHAPTPGRRRGTMKVQRSAFEKWRRTRRGGDLGAAAVRDEPPVESTREPVRATTDADSCVEALQLSAPRSAPTTGGELVIAAREAEARGARAQAENLFERALDSGGLDARSWWLAARALAQSYIDSGRDVDALEVLEELVENPDTSDPFPLLALADFVERSDPERAATLRERARRVAPWT